MYNDVLFSKEDTNRHTRDNKISKNYCCFRLELISVRLTSSYKLLKFLLYFFYKAVIIFLHAGIFILAFSLGYSAPLVMVQCALGWPPLAYSLRTGGCLKICGCNERTHAHGEESSWGGYTLRTGSSLIICCWGEHVFTVSMCMLTVKTI